MKYEITDIIIDKPTISRIEHKQYTLARILMSNMAYIWDLDGTLANIEHRLHFIKLPDDTPMYTDWKADWNAFNEACVDDLPITHNILLCQFLASQFDIIICTGRMGAYSVHGKTIDWLNKQDIPFARLLMRADKDYRSDHVVKSEMLDTLLNDGYEILGVFDDRKQVVDMWRNRGLMCYQVAEGLY